MDLQKQAKLALVVYLNSQVEFPKGAPIIEEDVRIVWFTKTLQNWKAMVITTCPDDMYYELTYNGDTKELYLDSYRKSDHFIMYPDTLTS